MGKERHEHELQTVIYFQHLKYKSYYLGNKSNTLGAHGHEKYCGSGPKTSWSATGPTHLERDQLICKKIQMKD